MTALRALLAEGWRRYGLRNRRRRLLVRALRKRRQLAPVADRTAAIRPGAILLFATIRNEGQRLPHFLSHYRGLGVDHFLIVDNASTDGAPAMLAAQPDVSLWRATAGYKQSRFGMDWINWLLMRHGSGHWCLTVDADEILIYPHHPTRPLRALTDWLADHGAEAMPAMMLDLYPKGPVEAQTYAPGSDPFDLLCWFDAGNYMIRRQKTEALWIQGGVRARHFFASEPRRAPTLTKIPLIRWHWRYAYLTSTHAALPPRLNRVYAPDGGEAISGLLLHTKFLPGIAGRSAEEMLRREHFENSSLYDAYYQTLMQGPDLWCPASRKLTGWRALEGMGLMSRGGWL